MQKQNKPLILALLAGLALSGAAQAALIGRDLNGSAGSFEAYYDTDLKITWLANANVNGPMNWADANTWAADLSFYDAVNNITYDKWRLPTVTPVNGTSFNYGVSFNGSTDIGYNISEQSTAYAGSTGSEMAHLFYNTLNNKGDCDPVLSTASDCWGAQAGWGLTNTGPFTNLQAGLYWSGTEYAPNTGRAWYFNFYYGIQGSDGKASGFYALAVSPGDVAAANNNPVPEPQTLALVGLGLLGLAMARRRG